MAASTLLTLMRAIAVGDRAEVTRILRAEKALPRAQLDEGATRQRAKEFFLEEIRQYVYAGDTALHVAAAGHRPQIARRLVAEGADPNARNRRGAQPLHYAAAGGPGSPDWLEGGADAARKNGSGSTPIKLATLATGRGRSGSPEARAQQAQILALLRK